MNAVSIRSAASSASEGSPNGSQQHFCRCTAKLETGPSPRPGNQNKMREKNRKTNPGSLATRHPEKDEAGMGATTPASQKAVTFVIEDRETVRNPQSGINVGSVCAGPVEIRQTVTSSGRKEVHHG
jgi:hypothetical protein